ncbi:MAG: HAMP domain-containing sensor histidine kinase [Planctomycetota bacterium]|nr:HAMP domain-containing sensor histidine kinase [Planctomycetota bacterium]
MLIRNRILLLVLTLLIFAIGGGLSALTVIHDLQLAIEASQKSRQDLISIGKIRDLLLITTGEIDHLQNWKTADRDRFRQQIDRCQQAIHSLVDPEGSTSKDEEEAIQDLDRSVKNFERAVTHSLRYLEEGIADRGKERTRNWLKERLVPEFSAAVLKLEQLQQTRIGALETRSQGAVEQVTYLLSILGVVMFLLCGSCFLLLRRWIISPLERLSSAAQQISKGQYGQRIPIPSGDEIGDLAREVETMSSDISSYQQQMIERERLAAVGEMTASVAHNLRNPLGSIRALAQGCLRSGDQQLVTPSLRTIMETVDRADRWLKDLLQGLKPIRLDRKPLEDLSLHLERIVAAVQGFAHKLQIELTLEISSTLPQLTLDLRRLEQAVIVLLNNAVEASGPGDTVVLKASTEDDLIIIEVRDQGTGMSEEILSRLFSPYFTTKKSGLGLGLSLTQRIIHGHGGRIDVVSSPGQGTTVTIRIPLTNPAENE